MPSFCKAQAFLIFSALVLSSFSISTSLADITKGPDKAQATLAEASPKKKKKKYSKATVESSAASSPSSLAAGSAGGAEVGAHKMQLMDKPSLKQYAQTLLDDTEITALYKMSGGSTLATSAASAGDSEIQKKWPVLWGRYGSQLQNLEGVFLQQTPFVRGEIEDEKVLGATVKWLQLAMLDARQSAQKGQWLPFRQHFSAWFGFAADLAYEESSLIGLRVSAVIRSLLLDELESAQQQYAQALAQTADLRLWFLQVRAPWPIDRVLVSEAKMRLKPAEIALAESVAQRLQKNPYQSVEVVLQDPKMRHSAQTAAADFLRQLWRDQDIQQMKTEINRISVLKIRMAIAEYQFRQHKAPASVADLVQARFLDQVPTDYFSGRPMDLSSASLTSAQKK